MGVSPFPCPSLGSQHPNHTPSQLALPAPMLTLKMPMPGSYQPPAEAMKTSLYSRPPGLLPEGSFQRLGLSHSPDLPTPPACLDHPPGGIEKSLRVESGGQARLRGSHWARHLTSVSPSAKWGQWRLPCWVPRVGGEGSSELMGVKALVSCK